MDDTTRALLEELRELRKRVATLERINEPDRRAASGAPIYPNLSAGAVVYTAADKSLATGSNLLYDVSSGFLKAKTGVAIHNSGTVITGSGGLAVGSSALPGEGNVSVSGTLAVTGNTNLTGALKLGSPAYTPIAGQISCAGALVAGAYIHPGNQTTYGITYSGLYPTGLYLNGDLVTYGALKPGNQNTYYITLLTGTLYANTMYTNAHFEAGGALICPGWFRSVGASGWFNATYGGGIWMQNTANVEVYGGKYFYAPAAIGVGVDPTVFAGTWRFGVNGLGTTSGTYSAVFRNGASSNLMYLVDNGTAWVNSAWNVGSDARYKKNITPIEPSTALDTVLQLKPVQYDLIANESHHTGFIAQDVQEIPAAEHTVSESEDGKLALAYEELSPYYAGAIQQLAAELASLKKELVSTKLELAQLKETLDCGQK